MKPNTTSVVVGPPPTSRPASIIDAPRLDHRVAGYAKRLHHAQRDARRWMKYMRKQRIVRYFLGSLIYHAIEGPLRYNRYPPVHDLASAGVGIHCDLPQFLESLGISTTELPAIREEHKRVRQDLVDRYKVTKLSFDASWAVEELTGLFLYYVVRLLKPTTVVETGVANGHSSFYTLAALTRNDAGTLHSFDIDSTAGVLVEDRARWRLHISNDRGPEAELRAELQLLGSVDVFLHDSDHRYLAQLFEYETTWPFMRPGGLFASDDINSSFAFSDFVASINQRPRLLLDRTKIIGAIRVP
jgi:predicted O-methyltransferase YrrM